MAFISILLVDILAIVIIFNLAAGIILGIAGLVMQVINAKDQKNGKEVGKIRKLLAKVFCILGVAALAVLAAVILFYQLKIVPADLSM